MKNKPINFIKMHGAGNDFVFLTPELAGRPITASLAKRLLDRHRGIGGDQLLYLEKGKGVYPFQLDIYNSDGSKAEMCGNGVRAVAYYLNRYKKITKDFLLKTKRGAIGIAYRPEGIEVDMGEPIIEGKLIPVKAKGPIINHRLNVKGKIWTLQSLSMGNPHCVVYVKDVKNFPVAEVGPQIENHPFFPNRVNVEFVQIISSSLVRARIWERGAGETLACGTGACAIAVAGARLGKTNRILKIEVPGGTLRVRWDQNNHVYLSGPADVTYEGRFYV